MNDTATREIWELTIPGRVTMTITNSLGRPQQVSAMGKGQRLRVSADDRIVAEESIRLPEHNPFRNGMLVRVDKSSSHHPSHDEIADDEMRAIFELDQDDFRETVTALGEINVRRLKALTVEADAARSQMEFIEDLIAERYPIGGSMPTYDAMQPQA